MQRSLALLVIAGIVSSSVVATLDVALAAGGPAAAEADAPPHGAAGQTAEAARLLAPASAPAESFAPARYDRVVDATEHAQSSGSVSQAGLGARIDAAEAVQTRVVVVNTTGDPDARAESLASVGALVDNPGPDGKIALAEAIAAINNSQVPGYTIRFGLARGSVIDAAFSLVLAAGGTTIDGNVDDDERTPDIIVRSPDLAIGFLVTSPDNVIRNVVASGISLSGTGADRNRIERSYVGTDLTGRRSGGRAGNGIEIRAGSDNVIESNVIAGNSASGIIIGEGATGNTVVGNRIGVDVTGERLANGRGVQIQDRASGNTVGGVRPDIECSHECNVIGGNSEAGVVVFDAPGNRVEGNHIGTDPSGSLPRSNGVGVVIESSADNVIGGAERLGVACDGSCNVISGNTDRGILIIGAGAVRNQVLGNYVGSDAVGAARLGNGVGVNVNQGAADNVIGGSDRGGTACTGSCNVISGNGSGVVLNNGTAGNTVLGNHVGADALGDVEMPNDLSGVQISDGASDNVVGGSERTSPACLGSCNLVSGNSVGVSLFDRGTTGNRVHGNYLGIDRIGRIAMPNSLAGVLLSGGPSRNEIGGTERTSGECVGSCNVISGNGQDGVRVTGTGTTGNAVRGNYVGLDHSGTRRRPNERVGIVVMSGAAGNTIGGERTAATCVGPCNVISGNTGDGVHLTDGGTIENVVIGNHVGVDASGTVAFGNGGAGVAVLEGASTNTIGIDRSSTPGQGTIGESCSGRCNLVSRNERAGVEVSGESTTGNTIRGNSIFANEGMGIDLEADGEISRNDGDDGDQGPNGLMNYPVGVTANFSPDSQTTTITGRVITEKPTEAIVDVYASEVLHPDGFDSGQLHVGSAVPDEDGYYALVVEGELPVPFLSTTATSGDGSTSEFGPRPPVVFVPGVAGSELNDGFNLDTLGERLPGDLLWPPSPFVGRLSVVLRRLSQFPADDPSPDIFAPDVFSVLPIAALDPYSKLLEMLETEAGYRRYDESGTDYERDLEDCDLAQRSENPSLFVFPYDWRKANEETADALREFVDCIDVFFPGSEIDVVAHSMGGLVARRYLLDQPTGHRVNKLTTLATPWLGAPKLHYVLETGDFLEVPFLTFLKPAFEYVLGSFPGAHQLLTSRRYYDLALPALVEDGRDLDGDGTVDDVFTFDEMIDVVDARYGQGTCPPTGPADFCPGSTSEAFHGHLSGTQDDWSSDPNDTSDPNHVTNHHFIGVEADDSTIVQAQASWRACGAQIVLLQCPPTEAFDLVLGGGDGTVPLPSAERRDVVTDLNAPGAEVVVYSDDEPGSAVPGIVATGASVEHNKINRNPVVLDALFGVLTFGHHSLSTTITAASASDGADERTGPTELPPARPLHYLEVEGARSVLVRDSEGNSTEPIDEVFRGEVPGVDEYVLGDDIWLVTIPTSGGHSVAFDAPERPVSIELRTGTSQTTDRAVRYRDVQLPVDALAQLSIGADGTALLAYDGDGDGVTETAVPPTVSLVGTDAADVDGPRIAAEVERISDAWQLSLSATDTESGLDELYVSADGVAFEPYQGPVVVDPLVVPEVPVFADDLAANRTTTMIPLAQLVDGFDVRITEPADGAELAIVPPAGTIGVTVSGAASLAAGVLEVVEVGVDGGAPAPADEVTPELPQNAPATVAWTTSIDLGPGQHEICARARVTAGSAAVSTQRCITVVVADAVADVRLTVSAEPEAVDSVGQVVSFRYVVENAGAVALDGPVEITDDTTTVACPALSSVGDRDDLLDPGELVTCEASYTVTAGDLAAGSIVTTARASVGGVNSELATLTVPVEAVDVARYTVVELGSLGGDRAVATSLNNDGRVVGWAEAPGGEWHAFAWNDVGGIIDLGTFGGDETAAVRINERGDVVGYVRSEEAILPFVWNEIDGGRILERPEISERGTATDINENGAVTGYVLVDFDQGSARAVAWFDGTEITDIGTASGSTAGTYAAHINNADQIAGTYTVLGGQRAFRWDEVDRFVDLGTLGGNSSIAWDLNDQGQVVGTSRTESGADRAFVWDETRGMIDLGTLGGESSRALHIDQQGRVFGTSDAPDGELHAFRWDEVGGMIDLGSFGDIPDRTVADMNDRGEAVGHIEEYTPGVGFEWSAVLWLPPGSAVPAADLAVSLRDEPDPVGIGDVLTYTVDVTNAGPDDAEGVVATITAPPGVALVSTSGCSEDPSGTPECELGSIPAGGTAQYEVSVLVEDAATDPVLTTVQVASNTRDPDLDDNSASEATTVRSGVPSQQLYFTTMRSGRIGDVRFRDEDIVSYDPATGEYGHVFDGSDLGIDPDLDGFELLADGSILMSFNLRQRLAGLGWVDDSDIVRFRPSSLGPDTSGTFELFLDGSDLGLTKGSEDIDAIAITPDGRLAISTLGRLVAGITRASGHDLVVLDDATFGPDTAGTLVPYFDGATEALTRDSERITAATIDPTTSALTVATRGWFRVPELSGRAGQLFTCLPGSNIDTVADCTFEPAFTELIGKKTNGIHLGDPRTIGGREDRAASTGGN